MAIIYLDIDKVKYYSKSEELLLDISKCKNDNEIIDLTKKYYESKGVMLNGVVVCQYDAIIIEIKKQIENYIKINKKNFSYNNIPADEYWSLKLNRDFMVFMLIDDITLPFDYFLFREDNVVVDEYYGYNNTDEVFEVLFRSECPSLDLHDHENVLKILRKEFKWFNAHRPGTRNNVSLEENVKEREVLNQKWEMSDKKDVSIKDARRENREQRKSLLRGNKKPIENRLKDISEKIKQVFLIDIDKITENELYDYYKLLILVYYFESSGIDKDALTSVYQSMGLKTDTTEKYQRIQIFEILSTPSIELTFNWFLQNSSTKSAYELELFRCEIIKHLDIEQIRKINKKILKINKCFNELFEYTATLFDFSPFEHTFEKRRYERITQTICKYKNPTNINKEKYNFSIWELVYFHYKIFCFKCEKATSKDSLNCVLNLENPACIEKPEKSTLPRLVQEMLENYKSTYLDYDISDLPTFLENQNWDNILPKLDKEKTETIQKNGSKTYGNHWVKKNIDNIEKAIKIFRRFNSVNMSTKPYLLEIVPEIQALYEINNRNIEFNAGYRNYRGYKKKPLKKLLRDINYFVELPEKRGYSKMSCMEHIAFEYYWNAFIKRWYGYDVQKYDLAICSFRLEIALIDLIMEKIQKIDDVDSFCDFMNNDLYLNVLVLYSRQVRKLDNQLKTASYIYHLSIENSDLLIEISHLFGWKYLKYHILHFLEGPKINSKLLLLGTPYEVYMRKDEVNRILHIDVVNILREF